MIILKGKIFCVMDKTHYTDGRYRVEIRFPREMGSSSIIVPCDCVPELGQELEIPIDIKQE